MKKTKRIACLFVAFAMLIFSIPFNVFADTVPNADAGAVNAWCEWNYTASTGTLYINTDGELMSAYSRARFDYEQGRADGTINNTSFTNEYGYSMYLPLYLEDNETLWNGENYVRHLVIGKDVTAIVNNSYVAHFISHTALPNLMKVTFEEGSSCKSIGIRAFKACTASEIELPDGLETIDEGAFSYAQINNMTLPDSVYSIGKSAFSNISVDSFKMPNYTGDEHINFGDKVFAYSEFNEFDFGNFYYIGSGAFNNAVFFKDDETQGELVFPDTVTMISDNAFANAQGIKSVVFSKNIHNINGSAFYNSNISFVDFSQAEHLNIGTYAFSHCNLSKVVFPNYKSRDPESDYAYGSDIRLGNAVFQNNPDLKSVVFGSAVTEIGSYPFTGCTQLLSVKFNTATDEEGKTHGVTSVGEGLFKDTAIRTVALPSTLNELSVKMFAGTQIGPVFDLSSTNITTIGDNAFENCANLKQILLPETLVNIGSFSFNNSGIESFTAPSSLEHIYSSALGNCTNLVSADLSASKITEINRLFENDSELTNVSLPDTLTKVVHQSFEGCNKLLYNLRLPDTVQTLGIYSFPQWGGSVFHFPQQLTNIGENAFEYSELNSLDLSGYSVGVIDDNAFRGSEHLKTVKLPDTLVCIGSNAFSYCPIDYLVMPSVERIYYAAFYRTSIKTLTIPENCYEINHHAFSDCDELTYVKLPKSLRLLSNNAFTNCEKLKTVVIENPDLRLDYITNAFQDLERDAVIYGYEGSTAQTFAENKGLTFIALTEDVTPQQEDSDAGICSGGQWKIENNELVISVNGNMEDNNFIDSDGNAFTAVSLVGEYNINKIIFENGIVSIPEDFLYSAADNLDCLKEIVFPYTLNTIGANSFRGLSGLENIEIPVFVNDIGEYAFAQCVNLNVSIPADSAITEFKEGVFYKTSVSNLSLPLKTEKICKKAFGDYQGSEASSIVIPSTCNYIYFNDVLRAENALGYTENGISDVKITVSTPYETYAYNIVKNNGVNCDFGGENIHGYYNGTDNVKESWHYEKDKNTVYIDSSDSCYDYLRYFNGELVKAGDVNSEKVVYTEGLSYIEGTPSGCTAAVFSPSYIYLPDSLEIIGYRAFKNCNNLKGIEIPSGVRSIESYSWGMPFDNCSSLASIDFKANIYKLPDFLFKNMRSLKYVDLGEHITTIGSQCFRNCVNLQEIIIPDSVRTVNEYAFSGCTMAERLVLGKNLSVVNGSAFSKLALCNEVEIRCSDFSGLNFQPWTTSIGTFLEGIGASTTGVTYRFADTAQNIKCSLLLNVKNIEVGTGVRSITGIGTLKTDANWSVDENSEYFMSYNGALYSKDGNTLLRVPAEKTAIDIKSGTKYIEGYAFTNSKVKTLTLPSGMVQIKDYAFYNASALKRISFPETLGYIGEFAFANCGLLKTLTFPESLRTIGGDAFYNCAQLASIILNEGLKNIGVAAFEKCKSIKSVVFPESVELINDYAFRNCSGLEDAYIWYADIGYNAFALTNVTIHTLADINGTVSNAYVYANENSIPVMGYTDADAFYDACEMARDINLGYLGFCEDGHGDIEWLTVYEADCEHDGYIIGVCEYCSEILDERHITACGHQYVETLHIPTTATTRGVNVYTCVNCGEKYCQYIDIPANAQQYTTQTVTGRIMIAENQSVTSGKNPARGASIMIDDTVVAKTDDSGYFTVALETGLYEAVIHYSFGFDRTVFIRIEDENLNAGKIYIIGCDFNRDGKLNNLDDNLFKMSMSSMPNDPSYLSYVDMNNDGVINVKDYAILKGCMGIDKATFRYEDIIIEK